MPPSWVEYPIEGSHAHDASYVQFLYDMRVVFYLKCINVGQNLHYDVLVNEINDIDGVGQVIFAFVIWTLAVFTSPVPNMAIPIFCQNTQLETQYFSVLV